MMDYAARVAQADTYPKLLRLNAKEHGNDIALREKDLGLWRLFTWNELAKRIYSIYASFTDNELKKTDELIRRNGWDKLGTEKEKITAVENFLKKKNLLF